MSACRYLLPLMPLLLTGCFFKSDLGKCHKPQEYQAARTADLVEVPDDLQSLPLEGRLVVPAGPRNTTATPKDQPCLVDPPAYTDRTSN